MTKQSINLMARFMFCALLLACGLLVGATAQSFKATLIGEVADAKKGVIPGATISLERADTGEKLTATTDAEGRYSFPQITPGAYVLRAEADGFAPYIEQGLILEVSQTRRLDLALQAGGLNEAVTVTASAAVVNTEISSKTEVMTTRQVEDLPLNGRNYLDLAKLLPGVQESPESPTLLNTNGTRGDATGYIQDGVSNRIDRLGRTSVTTSPDTIQEFRVETSSYSAQYGRTAGAQISVISKTGTNQFHGSLFEFVRNDAFDAQNPFSLPTDTKKLNRHQFGGTLGGPLALPRFGEGDGLFRSGKNRSFFFVSFDSYLEKRSINASTQAPNADWRKGDFRNLRGAGADGRLGNADDTGRILQPVVTFNAQGVPTTTRREFATPNVIPAQLISPIAQKLLAFIPAANVPGSLTGYLASAVNDRDDHTGSLRIDQRLNENSNFFVRYAVTNSHLYNPATGQEDGFYRGFGSITDAVNHLVSAGFTQTISPTRVNEFRFGYNLSKQNVFGIHNGRNVNAEIGLTSIQVPQAVWGFPQIRIDGFPEFGDRPVSPNNTNTGNYQLSDTLTWSKRGHSIKFGGEVFFAFYDENNFNNPRGNFRFRGRATNPANAVSSGAYSFADFLLGYMNNVDVGDVPPPTQFRNTQFSGYVQDDWVVTPRLTLNLGLRYDLLGPMKERNNRISNYVPQLNKLICATAEKAPCVVDASFPKTLIENDYNNFAPRVGFAFRPTPDNKLVVRGGGGIFYSTTFLALARDQLANSFPFTTRLAYNVPANPYNPSALRLDAPFTANSNVAGLNNPRGVSVDDPLGAVYQYNLTVERELGHGFVAEVGFVGSLGRHLGRRYNINPQLIDKAAIDFTRLNTQTDYVLPLVRRLAQRGVSTTFADIIFQENSATSNYNSGQFSLRRRARQGLVMQGTYTFSRSFDTTSYVSAGNLETAFQYPQDPDNMRLEYGLSDFDRAHRFTGSAVWDLPFGAGKRYFTKKGVGRALFGNLQINGTATYQTGRPFTPKLNAADFTGQRPDLLGDPLSNIPAGRFFNPFAFGDPSNVKSIDPNNPNLFGTAGRGLIRGPKYRPVNLSLIKNFRFNENWRAQFRVEAFNLLNQPNFDVPDTILQAPLFNETLTREERLRQSPSTAAFTRLVQPMRELQLGLRLTF
jgi:hypothetical protein